MLMQFISKLLELLEEKSPGIILSLILGEGAKRLLSASAARRNQLQEKRAALHDILDNSDLDDGDREHYADNLLSDLAQLDVRSQPLPDIHGVELVGALLSEGLVTVEDIDVAADSLPSITCSPGELSPLFVARLSERLAFPPDIFQPSSRAALLSTQRLWGY